MPFLSAFRLCCVASLLSALIAPAIAQDGDFGAMLREKFPGVNFQTGPMTASLGNAAEIAVPKGFWFVPQGSLRQFNDAMQNDTSSNDLGIILSGPETGGFWFVTFSFQDSGYVKDDDKDQINATFADNAMKAFREGQEQDNAQRRQRGWGELTLTGWEPAPFYDPQTNNLTWGLVVEEKNAQPGAGGEATINYQSRLLGRRGYMSATLVMGRDQAAEAIPAYKKLLTGYQFKAGQKYAEFQSGDKIAEYGLTALVGAGALAVAAKTGLLGKLIKPLIVGVLVLGGLVSKFFGSIFGRGKDPQTDA
ncbi:MAG TPA: DUF2167 domain-containing protein [Pirellulales bacterium]